MRHATITLLMLLFVGILPGQSKLVPHHARTDFLMASSGAMKFGLYGYDNPAILSSLHQPDVMFAFSDARGTWSDFNNWGLYVAVPQFGFGMQHYKVGNFGVSDYRISTGFGSRSGAFGLAYGWSAGETKRFNRASVLTGGALIRPNAMVSLGLTSTTLLRDEGSELVADLAVRPTGTELLTIFGDYAILDHQSLKDGRWSVGAVLEPMAGIRITGRYFDTKAMTIGFQFSFGRGSVASQAHYDADRNHAYNSYAIRLGAYDRNLLRKRFQKEKMYVSMNLRGPVSYQKFAWFDNSNKLTDIIEAIDAAEADPAVGGIVINTSDVRTDREKLWEIREKLKSFQSSGKKAIIFIDRPGIDVYHFASVADKVVLDPTGMVMLEGYLMGRTYLKGTLAKLGIGYDEWRFFKYKSAVESFSRESMSEADREQRQKLVDEYYAQAKKDIVEARNISAEKFDDLVNKSMIFLPDEALAAGLVDTLGRWDTAKEIVDALTKDKKNLVSAAAVERMQLPKDDRWGERPQIAVIYALGACAMDEGINARSLVRDVDAAVKNKNVKAIVLRVDSPGGDAMASDYIAEALKRAKGKKPVIVSQGYVAASGGYWLSMYADTIVGAPMTITGSIGVIGGWMYDAGVKEKLGMSTDLVKRGDHADLGFGFTLPLINTGIPDRNLNPDEREKMEHAIRSMYKSFVEKVASGRDMKFEDVEPHAQGRVWSGTDGKKLGLVDELGGLETAIHIAKQRAGIPVDDEVTIVELPKKGLFDFSMFMPRLFGFEVKRAKNDLLQQIELRLRHNGQPMPLMPLDDYDLTWER